MRVSTAVVGTLVGAGAAAGMAVDRHSARDLQSRAPQWTALYSCLTAGGDEFYAFFEQSVNGYTMCDPKEAVMAAPNLNVGNFKFKSFGVECEFFVDRPFDDTPDGLPVGHADCPGLKDIKGYKGNIDYPVANTYCGTTCTNKITLSWDGSLA